MLKTLAMPIILFAVTFQMARVVPSEPNQPAENNQRVTQKEEASSFACEHDCYTNRTPNNAYSHPPKWYTSLERPDWWLVILGFLTIGVVAYQSIQTAKSAKATEDSVRLQEFAHYQWVEIKNWKTSICPSEDPQMRVSYDVVNPTNYPLTLRTAQIIFVGSKKRFVVPGRLLLPKVPETFHGCIDIFKERRDNFDTGKLGLGVEISVRFVSVTGSSITLTWGGILHCGAKARFESTRPMERTPKPERPQ